VLLQQLANRILVSTPPDLEAQADPSEFAAQLDASVAATEPLDMDLASYQIWADHRLVVRSKNAPTTPLKPDFHNGFANQGLEDKVWRVYDASDGRGRIHVQVGKSPEQQRDVIFRVVRLWFMATTLLLGLPTLVIWLVIRWSFKPVDAMRGLIQKRQPFDLTPLPHEDIPTEVQTLVDSFNLMLRQVDNAVQVERRLIAEAAHELRTPLAVLAALAQVALRAVTLEEKNDVLRRLSAGVERSARLSEQLLDLARIDADAIAAEHTPLDLSELVVMVVRDFETTASQENQSIALDAEPAWTLGNIDDIGILVRNILDNAVRYSGKGSHIGVSCSYAIHNGAECVNLTVADNGPGVPPAARERIFDRFFRVPGNAHPGSGIGLSLVASIAKSHHALLEVGDGADGCGFRMSVYFRSLAFNPGGG
ncbi:MAG: ATP-binding protein, partial [Steroidobacteraceae bacterium]